MRKKNPTAARGYVENSLLQGEGIYGTGNVHWAILVMPFIVAAVGTALVTKFITFMEMPEHSRWWLLTILFPSLFLVEAMVYYATTEAAVTSARVISKTGWIGRKTDEISLAKVESILMDQSIVGRIFNFGTITVIGTGGNKVILRGLAKPMEFRTTVQAVAMNGV